MARLIKVDGNVTNVQPDNGGEFTNERLRELVGGWLEIIPLGTVDRDFGPRYLVMDEEGKLKGKGWNRLASALTCGRHRIVGDVLLCTKEELGE